MRHPTDDELNDLHDGLLPEAARATLAAHLAACTVCEDRAAALADLLDQLHGVPREIAPPDHLWAAVQSAIAATPVAPVAPVVPVVPVVPNASEASDAPDALDAPDAPHSPITPVTPITTATRRRPARRWLLAAAAAVLVAVSSSLTVLAVRDGRAPSADELVAQRIASEESLARFAELEAAYLRAAADLVDALERQRRAIPPEVAARAEESLMVIDAAVRETRAALADDPDNPVLAAMTLAAHRRKLEFLQQVRQWSTES